MGEGQINGNLQDVMITPEGATGTLVAWGRRTARMLSTIANPNFFVLIELK